MEGAIMRGKLMWVSLITAVTLLGSTACWASPEADDLIRLAKSGVDEEVLMSYIKAATDTFDLSADDIITLKDLGVPSKVISEALLHGHPADTSMVSAAKEEIHEITSDTAAAANAAASEAPAVEAQQPAETSEVSTAAAVAPPADDQNISFFYQSLYPYGNWLNIDGQWCWQPTATTVSPDWAPYCRHGHWIWSDWGWCWESDYSWGWAPFHYGRWFRHPQRGWCWVPDAQWGPAWVSWRTGDDYCGWAPLPPRTRFERDGFYFKDARVSADFEFNLTARDYFFLPKGNFCDPHPWVHMVPSIRAGEAYNRTVFEKDAYRFDHDHVFNGGPPVDDIGRSSHRDIRPVTIAPNNIRPGELIPRGTMRGDRFVIYKPTLSPQAPRSPLVIKAELEKQPLGGLPVRVDAKSKERITRVNSVWQQTLKIQQANANAAERQRTLLVKQAQNAPNAKQQAAFNAEADVQSMRAQKASAHVNSIKQWSPPSGNAPVIMPRSRVVPQSTPGWSDQARTQVRAQVRSEAQREDQQSRVAEQMVRTPPSEPRSAPQQEENRGGGGRGR
jgi:hypothetical protein